MSSQRVCQIIPVPTDVEERRQLAKDFTTDEGVLGCLVNPHQAVFVGLADRVMSENPPGNSIANDISSSLSTAFFVGPVALAEASLEKWAYTCFGALNTGLSPSDSDGVILALWQHPTKDMAMLAILASGDWAADLEQYLPDVPQGLTQVASSGNDNEPIGFLPDFLEAYADGLVDDLDPDEQYDVVETVLLTLNEEWHDETLDHLKEEGYKAVVKRYKAATSPVKKAKP